MKYEKTQTLRYERMKKQGIIHDEKGKMQAVQVKCEVNRTFVSFDRIGVTAILSLSIIYT